MKVVKSHGSMSEVLRGDAHTPRETPPIAPLPGERPAFRTVGTQVLREGKPFADCADEQIAFALALALDGQVLFAPGVPLDLQEQAAKVLWP